MYQYICIESLLLDLENPRIVRQGSQNEARNAILSSQKHKLVTLANDIAKNQLSPIDLTMVIDAEDGLGNFIVLEGNRRLAAIQLMKTPQLAEGSPYYAAFKKLNADQSNFFPTHLHCWVVPNRQEGLIWIERKHGNDQDGKGTEKWTSMSNARVLSKKGDSCPEMDIVNFVLGDPTLDKGLRSHLEGADFHITTVKRLVDSKVFREQVGFELKDGDLILDQDTERMLGIFTDLLTIISQGKYENGEKFTVKDVYVDDDIRYFLSTFLPRHPVKKKANVSLNVTTALNKKTPIKSNIRRGRKTPTLEEQGTLIPRDFNLSLPSGKANEIFAELKKLDINFYKNAAAVLFRVFLEITFKNYILKNHINVKKDSEGKEYFMNMVNAVLDHAESTSRLSKIELKALHTAKSKPNHIVSFDTMHAYIHNPSLNPKPQDLKSTWADFQLIIERLWAP